MPSSTSLARVATVALLVAATGCAAGARAPASGSRLIERTCDLAGHLPPADCYWFEVPERRSDPGSRLIRLWVAVVHGTGAMADDLPAIGLAGGPGDADSTAWVSGDLVFAGGANPTLVVIDQRGTGRSRPRLACPELDPLSTWPGPTDELVDARRGALEACRSRLVDDGADVDGYSTAESATDVVELRRALGIDRWIVQGWSYGGRLAQEVYRQDPTGVAGLVLDGTVTTGPWQLRELADTIQTAIDRVDVACAAVPACSVHGSVRANLDAAAASLDAAPYRDRDSGLVVDGPLLRAGVVEAMYRQDLTRALPGALAALAGGDRTPLPELVRAVAPLPQADVDGGAEGTRQIVTCADQGDGDTVDDAQLLASAGAWSRRLLFHASFCDIWRVDARGLRPARGDVPVLAFAGELDPVQPVAFTNETTAGFTNRTVVVVPGGAHRNAYANECTRSITLAFFAEPTAALDLTCVALLPPAFTEP